MCTTGTGIKSSERVKDYGEVFTPDKIVNDMLDLVDEQLGNIDADEYINKTFLEPACGDGQFLIRILYRKLMKVLELPVEQRALALVKSVASIYAVDIQEDNVEEARKRVYNVAIGNTVSTFDLNNKTQMIIVNLGIEMNTQLKNVIGAIIEQNIIVGNTLEKNNIELISYHFDDTNVSVATASLSNLALEYNKTKTVNYIELPQILNKTDTEYDISYGVIDTSVQNNISSNPATTAKPKPKVNSRSKTVTKW